MSTLPGQASKGEKTKSKFQSLDINSLYRVSRGENPEKQQQKSSLPYVKHGMQSLGKVPNARRAPANLPSLKAEHSGSDAAVPLVPPGAPGWGKQDTSQSSSGASPPQQQQNQQGQATLPPGQTGPGIQQQPQPQLSSHQAAIALPVTTTIPPHPHKTPTPTAQNAPANDKLWSTVMGGQEAPQPPLYQSPQFQHEFPSLSAGDGGPTRIGSDAPQYPSGLSLRPQTEGSWTQGGQRVTGAGTGGAEAGQRGPGLPGPGGPPQLPAQGVQQQQQLPPQIRGVLPSFMCKGNTFQQPSMGLQNNQVNQPPPANGHRGPRSHGDGRQPPRLADHRDDVDTVAPRPIIKEEELSRMDEIGKDMGWAESDDVDYNQTLTFSDDESDVVVKKENRRHVHQNQQQHIQNQQHNQNQYLHNQQQPYVNQHQPHVNQQQQHGNQQQLHGNQQQPHVNQQQPHVSQQQPLASQQQSHMTQQQQHVNQQQPHVSQQQPHASQQQQHVSQQQPHESQQQPHASQQQLHVSQQQLHTSPQQQPHVNQQQSQSHQPQQNRDYNNRDDRNDSHVDSQQQQRQWSSARSTSSRGRSSEDEDTRVQQRRNQTDKEVEMAVLRAKQRKEEEEKRFNEERKQGAAKKLLELEEKMQKRDRDNHEGVGTINPSSVPPKPINHVDIPLPDFQKDKERDRDTRSRIPVEVVEENNQTNQSANQSSNFRHLTQIEGKNFPRKKTSDRDRERDRDRDQAGGPNFSRHFQHDLPPRFLKNQRNNSNSNLQAAQQAPYYQFDNRWSGGSNQSTSPKQGNVQQGNSPRNNQPDGLGTDRGRHEEIEDERRDYKRQGSEDSYRSSHHSQQDLQKALEPKFHDQDMHPDNRHQNLELQYSRRDRGEEKWEKDKEPPQRHSNDNDWIDKCEKPHQQPAPAIERHDHGHSKEQQPPPRHERSHRPDSRNSRTSRHQRDSDYIGQWSEAASASSYEDNRRRDDRRAVPGPITKDRIEADDDGRSEKRGLTQLKRGHAAEAKLEARKEETKIVEEKKEQVMGAWADSIPSSGNDTQSKSTEEKKGQDNHKPEQKSYGDQSRKLDEYNQNRHNRSYASHKKGWGNAPNDYHYSSRSQNWPKSSRGHRLNREHHTDSDASAEDHSIDHKNEKQESRDPKSPKPAGKFEKDEKNRESKHDKFSNDQKKTDKPERKDNYVPKGEPSRYGRGGGTFSRGRMSGMNKRMDGYSHGPPSVKSSFGHHDDKEKKTIVEEVPEVTNVSNTPPVEATPSVDDKIKQSQQALAAGIIGKRVADPAVVADDKSRGRNIKQESRKPKPRGRDDGGGDMNSDHSDDKNKDSRKTQGKPQVPQSPRSMPNANRGRNNQPPRMGGEKRGNFEIPRQNFNSAVKKDDKLTDQNTLVNAIADISLKNHEAADVEEKEEKLSVNGDSEGFQEVKSKKAVKERQKSTEDKSVPKSTVKVEVKDVSRDRERKNKSATQQLTQQQIQNIPSLMATPVNPPPILNKMQFDRQRQSKLPPRFAKQKLQKAAQMQQQHHSMCGDIGDMNKVNQNMNMYVMKETASAPPSVTGCAWDKPLGSQLRNMEHENMLGIAIDNVKSLDGTQAPSQGTSPNNEKMMSKSNHLQEKALLDGSTPPINTIIFENTNFKSAPGSRNARSEKPRPKMEDPNMEPSVMSGFNKQPTMNELLQTKNENKPDAIQLPLFKEDTADMKLDFFGSDLQFTDDKNKNLCLGKPLHAITSGNNTVDSLDIKIASVKKVWETSEQQGEDNQINFGGPPLESNVFNQGKDMPDDNHEGYSPSPNQTVNTSTNICKVKPTQQVSATGQTVLSSAGHQQHSGIVAQGLMANPLSPPPMAPVLSASVGIGPQQYTTNQHMGYQPSLSGSTQYGIPAIPSPPTVPLVYSQTQQQLQAAQSLYGAFPIDQSGVLGGQGRSFSQYPNFAHHAAAAGLGQTASSPYTTHQSVYLPTAPPHPPPTAQAPPELYPNMGGYRLSAAAAAGTPFAQSQQLNNSTTVLISSTSNSNNSLMSATVKGGSQAISAIGTKAGGIGQAYQQQSAQQQQQQQQQGQVYMTFDPSLQANYLAAAVASPGAAMQRGPGAQVQSNVVAGLQPSSSFYSGSTGQTGYFQQPGNSNMSSAQLQQHQAGYGLQGNVFNTHNQSHTNTGMQNYNSHFLNASMQVAAAALNAQQFRSAYMKGVGNQQIGDQSGRPQQLKSPSSQEVLSSVFNSGTQIPSPKSRQNCKHPPPQSSPTAQQKYNMYQSVGHQNSNIQRYPTPIQRPIFQQMQQNNSVNQKHKNNPNNKAPNRQYYGGQNNSLSVQNEKTDDSKMNDSTLTSSANNSAGGVNSSVTMNVAAEKVKENIKEEAVALKD